MNIIKPSFPLVAPPWQGIGKKIESLLRKTLKSYELLPDDHNLAIALSGGKDSLTLLLMLAAISGRGFPKLNLSAFLIDGAFSCGAGVGLDFLRGITSKLGIPFHVIDSGQKTLEGLECYGCSRKRRTLLFNHAKEKGFQTIAFGHHRDDNIQTLLMNLFHKGEFAGNLPKVPMKRYQVTIIRPLILVPEELIIEFAKQQNFHRIMCQCPIGQNSVRKQTEQLIKEIEEVHPRVRHNLSLAALNYGSNKALEP